MLLNKLLLYLYEYTFLYISTPFSSFIHITNHAIIKYSRSITSIVNIANIHLITTIVSNTILRTTRKSTNTLPCSIQSDLIHTLKWVLVHFHSNSLLSCN